MTTKLALTGELRLDLLSTREREVLDLAVDGRTDEQIGQAMGLTTATVNSYWVRIRSKLGHFSRTELVGAVLRHEASLRHADLVADVARLTEIQDRMRADLDQSQADLRAMRGASWHLLALDHVPVATLVCNATGRVAYANLQAQHLFFAKPGELEGTPLYGLAATEIQSSCRTTIEAVFGPDAPERVVVGVESPFYACRRDGVPFRAVLVAERFVAPSGLMSAVAVREAMQDVEAFVAMLRRPFVMV